MSLLSILMMAAAIGMSARIAQKAGFSGWWGLTQIVPLVGLVMVWVLAFVDWRSLPPPHGNEEERLLPPPD
ncbi:MAG: hypothetical protein OEN55_16995 [Alphaproteobacteria bacterium]|nr:hypothetical protein [Alphaproteobacteria bacterium]